MTHNYIKTFEEFSLEKVKPRKKRKSRLSDFNPALQDLGYKPEVGLEYVLNPDQYR